MFWYNLSKSHKVTDILPDKITPDEEQDGAAHDPRRASVASRRTCTSNQTGPFFPNVSRSPRDLTSLAAKVHSPSTDKVLLQSRTARTDDPTERFEDGEGVTQSTKHNAKTAEWQLPFLTFRPLRLEGIVPDCGLRPQTSGEILVRSCTEIFAPTPERPVSSQSRKRFSKILDLSEDASRQGGGPFSVPRSYHSLNSSVIRSFPRMSEESFRTLDGAVRSKVRMPLPNGSQDQANDVLSDIVGAYADTGSSQNTNPEKSTIDSLLDRHIECLGLQTDNVRTPEGDFTETPLAVPQAFDSLYTPVYTSFATSGTPGARPSTSRSWNKPLRAKAVQVHPSKIRRFFSVRDRRDASTTSYLNDHSPKSRRRHAEAFRTLGWLPLPSTSQVPEHTWTGSSLLSGELADISSNGTVHALDMESTDIPNENGATTVVSPLSKDAGTSSFAPGLARHALVANLNRHVSERRKIRLRLKTHQKLESPLQIDNNANPFFDTSRSAPAEELLSPLLAADRTTNGTILGKLPELSGECIPRLTASKEREPLEERKVISPPRVPDRWSSILAFAYEPVKKSADVVRKASTRTAKSNTSSTRLAEPINSTRLSSHIQRSESQALLVQPEFKPFETTDLNLSFAYAQLPSIDHPTLPETQSFFSDDSNVPRHIRASTRKRLHLHSLRGGTPAASRENINAATGFPQSVPISKIHHSCQTLGQSQAEQPIYYDGTVAMSDFAYRKRKIKEKLREWWNKKDCLQRKLLFKKS